MEGPDRGKRLAPFVAAAGLGFLLLPLFPDALQARDVALAGVAAAAVVLITLVAPWPQLPAAAQALPPLGFFAVVALLRDSGAGTATGYTPLVMVPVVWFALYGDRRELALSLAGVVVTLGLPILVAGRPQYPASDWRLVVLWLAVAGIVGCLLQSLVAERADRAREAARRAAELEALSTLARTDPLTGLPNRRAFEQELPREVARAAREGRPVCVAVLDVDGLKEYNDAHGHPAGDRLLRDAAGAWRSALRRVDLLARFGGDEFAAILPGAGAEEGRLALERARGRTPLRTSAGLAAWDGQESAQNLLQRADRALLEAKGDGGSRVVVAPLSPVATG